MTSTKTKTILVGGCFDVIHYGHLVFLRKARSLGNELVVLLESDEKTKKLKGEKRPIHTQKQRRQMLLELKSVDRVATLPKNTKTSDYLKFTKKINPEIIAATEGDPHLHYKNLCAAETGAKIVILPKIKVRSTSQIYKLLKVE